MKNKSRIQYTNVKAHFIYDWDFRYASIVSAGMMQFWNDVQMHSAETWATFKTIEKAAFGCVRACVRACAEALKRKSCIKWGLKFLN